MSEWKPINSAPDKGAFLVYIPHELERKQVQSAYKIPSATMIVGGVFEFDLSKKPTHWMPLPPPPTKD